MSFAAARRPPSAGAAATDEIAYLPGYQDPSSFYRAFREWEGVTPSEWRARHAGATPASLH